MSEAVGYFFSVFAICATLGMLGLISYKQGGGAERAAFSAILLCTVISPIASVTLNIDPEGPLFNIEDSADYDGGGYTEAIAEAFAEGIARGICDEFSLRRQDVSVRAYGFVPTEMRAEEIKIVLSGLGALSDTKAIKKYVDSMEVGECDVNIEIG